MIYVLWSQWTFFLCMASRFFAAKQCVAWHTWPKRPLQTWFGMVFLYSLMDVSGISIWTVNTINHVNNTARIQTLKWTETLGPNINHPLRVLLWPYFALKNHGWEELVDGGHGLSIRRLKTLSFFTDKERGEIRLLHTVFHAIDVKAHYFLSLCLSAWITDPTGTLEPS